MFFFAKDIHCKIKLIKRKAKVISRMDPVILFRLRDREEDPPVHEGRQLWDRTNPFLEYKPTEFRYVLLTDVSSSGSDLLLLRIFIWKIVIFIDT